MSKIILKHPITNEIQIVEVRIGGGVAEGIEVIWDEKLHGDIPENFVEANICGYSLGEVSSPLLDELGNPMFETYIDAGGIIQRKKDANGQDIPLVKISYALNFDADKFATYEAAVKNPTLWIDIKAKRDALLNGTIWMAERHVTQVGGNLPTNLTNEKYIEWCTYWQALRDIPESCQNPGDVVWPVKPI